MCLLHNKVYAKKTEKKYFFCCSDEKGEKGHEDKEKHEGEYDEKKGHKKKYNDDKGYFHKSEKGEKGEKGKKFHEEGMHRTVFFFK